MPTLSGYHHLNLSVPDVDKSAAWYCEVFGFKRVREVEKADFARTILVHPDGNIFLGLTGHGRRASGDPFTEFRTGLDHVAFAVADRKAVEEWNRRFEELGVRHSEIKERGNGLITLRDPDNVQLEVYAPGG